METALLLQYQVKFAQKNKYHYNKYQFVHSTFSPMNTKWKKKITTTKYPQSSPYDCFYFFCPYYDFVLVHDKFIQ